MSKVTDHFRQAKPQSTCRQRGSGKSQEPELLGAHGEAAVTNFDISDEERVLRAFDLATEFGPCTGITRLERWKRAERFGLNPPLKVKEMLTGPRAEEWNNCLWEGRL